MTSPAIEAENLTKIYRSIRAVDSVSLTIQRGEFFGLIGPNGAGKTTLFRILLGLTAPTAGKMRIMGIDVSVAWPRKIRAYTGYLPENIFFYEHMSGLETLRFYAAIKGAPGSDITGVLEKVGLKDAAKRKVSEYSRGMRQRLGLAQALLGRPEMLFLDEPTSGLDPEGTGMFFNLIREVKDLGVTIVMTSHILREIQDRVDRLGIIGKGRLIAQGTVRELRSRLGLKSTINITFEKAYEESIRDSVVKAGGEHLVWNDGKLTFNCTMGDKIRVMKKICNGEGIIDIEFEEPSLEDVFMGYTGAEGRNSGDTDEAD